MKDAMDSKTFFSNFAGMESLALETITAFLNALPQLLLAIESALQQNNPEKLELSAHTLKGVVSNFYAEPSRVLADELEIIGSKKTTKCSEILYNNLKNELHRLQIELTKILKERNF